MEQQINKLNFEDQNIYVGIDVHLQSWSVSILVEEIHHKTFSQPPKPELLVTYLKKNFPRTSYHTAYEAGFCGFWIHYYLKNNGVNSIVIHPADVPTSQKEQVRKSDSVDSLKIARSLRAGVLVPLHIAQETTLADRSIVRMRKTLVKDIARIKTRIKGFLNFNGIEFPTDVSSKWTHGTFKWLNLLAQDLQDSRTDTLRVMLHELDTHRESLRNINRKIRELFRNDRYRQRAELLKTVPGIGFLNAMILLTHIEDISRFRKSDQLASFIGIVPDCHSSGERINNTGITFRGVSILKNTVIECSWVAVRADPALMLSFTTYTKRMNANKAIVRIARKLINRIFYVLKNNREYEKGVVVL